MFEIFEHLPYPISQYKSYQNSRKSFNRKILAILHLLLTLTAQKNSFDYTVKPVLAATQKEHQKLVFNTDYRLMQVKSIADGSKGSILQYFRPSLSYHLSFRPLFCLFLSGHLRLQVICASTLDAKRIIDGLGLIRLFF